MITILFDSGSVKEMKKKNYNFRPKFSDFFFRVSQTDPPTFAIKRMLVKSVELG